MSFSAISSAPPTSSRNIAVPPARACWSSHHKAIVVFPQSGGPEMECRPPAYSRSPHSKSGGPAQFAEFRALPGAGAVVLPPKAPEHTGIVERNNDYLETSFLPGRTFTY